MDLLFMNIDLLSLTSEIGYVEDGVYKPDENCSETLAQINELVEEDDDFGSTRQQLAASNIFETDLLPLLENQNDEDTIFEPLIKFLSAITCPLSMKREDKVHTVNKKIMDDHQENFKRHFARAVYWVRVREQIEKGLNREFTKTLKDVTGHSFNLVRNLIEIESDAAYERTLCCFADSGIAKLIQYVGIEETLNIWHLHVTEIIYSLYKNIVQNSLVVDTSMDPLSFKEFINAPKTLKDCKIDYSPAMDHRLSLIDQMSGTTRLFLRFYMESFYESTAEQLLSSLRTKIHSVSGKSKHSVAGMCLWFIKFLGFFELELKELNTVDRLVKINQIGMDLVDSLIPLAENNEDFLNQACHFFLAFGHMAKTSEVSKVFTDVNLKVQAMSNAKLRILIHSKNPKEQKLGIAMYASLILTLRDEDDQSGTSALEHGEIIKSVLTFIEREHPSKIDDELVVAIYDVLQNCEASVDELTNAHFMKLVLLKSETSHPLPSKICRVINESTSNEDELREKLQKLSAGDAELLRELCALFSVSNEPAAKKRAMEKGDETQVLKEQYQSLFNDESKKQSPELKLIKSRNYHQVAFFKWLREIALAPSSSNSTSLLLFEKAPAQVREMLDDPLIQDFLSDLGCLRNQSGQWHSPKESVIDKMRSLTESMIVVSCSNDTITALSARSLKSEKKKKKRGIGKKKNDSATSEKTKLKNPTSIFGVTRGPPPQVSL